MSIFEIMLSPGKALDYDKQLYVYNHVVLKDKNYRALELLSDVPNFDPRIEGLMASSSDYHILKIWASLPTRSSDELKARVDKEKRVTVLKEIAAVTGLDSEVYEALASKNIPVVSAYLLMNPTLSESSARMAFDTVFNKSSIFSHRFHVRGLKTATYYTETSSVISMWPGFVKEFISSADSQTLMVQALEEYDPSKVVDLLSTYGCVDEFFVNVLYPLMSNRTLPSKVVSFVSDKSRYYRYSTRGAGSDPGGVISRDFLDKWFSRLPGLVSSDAQAKASVLLNMPSGAWWDPAYSEFKDFAAKTSVASNGAVQSVLLSRIKNMDEPIDQLVSDVITAKDQDAALKVFRRSDVTVQHMERVLSSSFMQRVNFGGLSLSNAVKLVLARSRNPVAGWVYLDTDSRFFYREVFKQAGLSGYAVPTTMVSLRFFKPEDISMVSSRVLTAQDAPIVLKQAAADLIAGFSDDPAFWVEVEELAIRMPNLQLGQLVDCVKDLAS